MLFNKTTIYAIVIGVLFFVNPCTLFSQNETIAITDSTSQYMETIVDYTDFSSLYLNLESEPQEDFGANPYLLPVVFDGKFADDLSIQIPPLFEDRNHRFFPLDTLSFQSEGKRYIDQLRRKSYRNLLDNHIELVKYNRSDFPEKIETTTEMKPNPFFTIFKMDYEPVSEDVDVADYFKPKKRYWIKNGSSLIQFSQNYISDNWYKGGIGNLNLLSVQNYTANYKKGKKQFNNFFEWKLSFYTNPNDTLRSFRIGDDLLRYYGDFGIQAFNDKWFYSANIEVKTQLFRNCKENSSEIISSWLSPLIVNVGILGMKYQLEKSFPKNKYKKLNLSADVSPLSVQYTRVMNEEVDKTRFGIKEGDPFLLDLGSTINAKLIVNFNREITFTSRFKLFTNYEKTIIESENELNLSINRYFSTRLYFYPRFDDSKGMPKEKHLGYIQLNEVLSFGFNFKW